VTGPTIAIYAFMAVVVAEAVVIAVLSVQIRRWKREVAELRRKVDTRATLLSGGQQAVKTMWQTANILRKEGFGAAVRSNIEDRADWA